MLGSYHKVQPKPKKTIPEFNTAGDLVRLTKESNQQCRERLPQATAGACQPTMDILNKKQVNSHNRY